jgi:hypothetical protein
MNNNNKFQQLIDNNKYQVFIFVSPGSIPFNFASHPWFVINKLGAISRWEVLFRKTPHPTKWGHLYKDFYPPFRGIEIIPFWKKFFWPGKLLGIIEGETAKKMAEFLENSPTAYSYCNKYNFLEPNSNTYAQWVLNNFPEIKIKLPWNSFGKNFDSF